LLLDHHRQHLLPGRDEAVLTRPRLYLAGPEVFLRNAKKAGAAKAAICTQYGLEGCFPLDAEIETDGLSLPEIGFAIFRANEALLDSCDGLIANLTPFRGPGMDAGTAYEIGYMRAKGRPVFGYSNDGRCYFDRVKAHDAGLKRRKGGLPGMEFEDSRRLGVEQFGFTDNLMIDAAMAASGAPIVSRKTRRRDIYTGLAAFEDCVRLAAAAIKGG
jgi:nucleoside 2-deoxyribosyltransferase